MYRIFYKESFFQYLKPSPFLLNIYPNRRIGRLFRGIGIGIGILTRNQPHRLRHLRLRRLRLPQGRGFWSS